MSRKPIIVFSVLALSLATIWTWERVASIDARASEGAAASGSREQATGPDSRSAAWEYKILIGSVASVVRVAATSDGRGQLFPSSNAEEEINRFAAQGYVVDSFQPFCSVEGGRSGVSFPQTGSPQLVVLMKRIRK